MRILSIETSCDETAVAIVEATGNFPAAKYRILAHALFSQVDIHREYGGVFPNVAKREHARTLVPMLEKALKESGIAIAKPEPVSTELRGEIHTLLIREKGLFDALEKFLEAHGKPEIDLIAVTQGPGLEPALWVGINFARALGRLFDTPVMPINHMEGHIYASIFNGTRLENLVFPAVILLISGGHTELILMQDWNRYEKIGETRDDAVGEAFDKVARMLGLPYPGGPEISRLAALAREKNIASDVRLPRPMLRSGDFDFSFSGLKTAVLYEVKDKTLTDEQRASIAREFEEAAAEVLLEKTLAATKARDANSIIVGGGVTANSYIRKIFEETFVELSLPLYLSERALSTDNAIMIALAAHAHSKNQGKVPEESFMAVGNLSLH